MITSTTPEGFDPEDTQSVRIPVMPLAEKIRTENLGLVDRLTTQLPSPEPTRLTYWWSDGGTFTDLMDGALVGLPKRELGILRVSLIAALEELDSALRGEGL